MRSKLVLIIALALLLGSSTGVLATDLSQNGGPDQAAMPAVSLELQPSCATAEGLSRRAEASLPPAPREARDAGCAWRC